MSAHEREYLGNLSCQLMSIRLPDEAAVIINVGTHAAGADCPTGHVSVSAAKLGETATSEAIHLQDALLLVRAKLDRQIAAKDKARADAKGAPCAAGISA